MPFNQIGAGEQPKPQPKGIQRIRSVSDMDLFEMFDEVEKEEQDATVVPHQVVISPTFVKEKESSDLNEKETI